MGPEMADQNHRKRPHLEEDTVIKAKVPKRSESPELNGLSPSQFSLEPLKIELFESDELRSEFNVSPSSDLQLLPIVHKGPLQPLPLTGGKCPICGHQSYTTDLPITHVSACHMSSKAGLFNSLLRWTVEGYACNCCSMTFDQISGVSAHMFQEHPSYADVVEQEVKELDAYLEKLGWHCLNAVTCEWHSNYHPASVRKQQYHPFPWNCEIGISWAGTAISSLKTHLQLAHRDRYARILAGLKLDEHLRIWRSKHKLEEVRDELPELLPKCVALEARSSPQQASPTLSNSKCPICGFLPEILEGEDPPFDHVRTCHVELVAGLFNTCVEWTSDGYACICCSRKFPVIGEVTTHVYNRHREYADLLRKEAVVLNTYLKQLDWSCTEAKTVQWHNNYRPGSLRKQYPFPWSCVHGAWSDPGVAALKVHLQLAHRDTFAVILTRLRLDEHLKIWIRKSEEKTSDSSKEEISGKDKLVKLVEPKVEVVEVEESNSNLKPLFVKEEAEEFSCPCVYGSSTLVDWRSHVAGTHQDLWESISQLAEAFPNCSVCDDQISGDIDALRYHVYDCHLRYKIV